MTESMKLRSIWIVVTFWSPKFKNSGSGGIRTHASEETGALNQRLRPLGHATFHAIGTRFLLDF